MEQQDAEEDVVEDDDKDEDEDEAARGQLVEGLLVLGLHDVTMVS